MLVEEINYKHSDVSLISYIFYVYKQQIPLKLTGIIKLIFFLNRYISVRIIVYTDFVSGVPNFVVQWLTLEPRICKISGLNLGPDTGYPD
jgi:hypothetical protein